MTDSNPRPSEGLQLRTDPSFVDCSFRPARRPFSLPYASTTTWLQMTSIFGFASVRFCIILLARNSSRRWMMYTWRPRTDQVRDGRRAIVCQCKSSPHIAVAAAGLAAKRCLKMVAVESEMWRKLWQDWY